MKAVLRAVAVLILCTSIGAPALAVSPSCDRVREALSRSADPTAVARDLDTTRARVNACAKIGSVQDRGAERRDELHRERQQRGLNH